MLTKVEASKQYKERALNDLKAMIKSNDFEGLGNIVWGLNKLSIWQDTSKTEKEIAKELLNDLLTLI